MAENIPNIPTGAMPPKKGNRQGSTQERNGPHQSAAETFRRADHQIAHVAARQSDRRWLRLMAPVAAAFRPPPAARALCCADGTKTVCRFRPGSRATPAARPAAAKSPSTVSGLDVGSPSPR